MSKDRRNIVGMRPIADRDALLSDHGSRTNSQSSGEPATFRANRSPMSPGLPRRGEHRFAYLSHPHD